MEKGGNDAARPRKSLSTRCRAAHATPRQGDQPKRQIQAALAPGGRPVALSACNSDNAAMVVHSATAALLFAIQVSLFEL
jgi:hypothetical protein